MSIELTKKMYIIYDYRAMKNTEDAEVFSVEDTLQEAIDIAKDCGGVIYSYDKIGDQLLNEKFVQSVEANP